MSALGTYLLVTAAFVGTVLFFIDPGPKLNEWSRGKKKSDLRAAIGGKFEEDPAGAMISGCGFLVLVLFGLGYAFVVEPLAVIVALVNKIGYQPLAYAILAIVAISWIWTIRMFAAASGTKNPKADETVTTWRGRVVREPIEIDEELKTSQPFWLTVRRIFFFLPDLYLWYLFLVVVGVVK